MHLRHPTQPQRPVTDQQRPRLHRQRAVELGLHTSPLALPAVAQPAGPDADRVNQGMRVPVAIRDRREHFGRVDLYVTPAAGDGVRWVQAHRVEPHSNGQG